MNILAIDADPLIYEAGFAVEHKFYDVTSKGHIVKTFEGKRDMNAWLKEVNKTVDDFIIHERVETEPLSHATSILTAKIKAMVNELHPEQVFCYLTSTDKGVNFREYIASTRKYKERNSSRPVYYSELRDYMIAWYEAKVVSGYEADDAVAMIQYEALEEDQTSCIATVDKDLNMIPGWHYNYQKKTMYYVTQEEAMHSFYKQLLMGDSTDTIPGVPKIGEKKADAALDGCVVEKDYHEAAVKLYQAGYGDSWEHTMIEQARLLWMLRFPGDRWFPYGDKRREK